MARKKVEPKKVEQQAEPQVEQVEPQLTRIDSIKAQLGKGAVISLSDCEYLIAHASSKEQQIKRITDVLEELKTKYIDQQKQAVAFREILTLWLAMRGSSSLEMFQATQGLANRTVGLLNQ